MSHGLRSLRVLPGSESAFDETLRNAAPRLAVAAAKVGVRNLTVFRRGTDVWLHADSDARSVPFRALLDHQALAPWGRLAPTLLAPIAGNDADGPWLSSFRQIFAFETRSPGLSPLERGCLVVIVDPARGAEYDERHAKPWPSLLGALARTGFDHYIGFRSGSQAVYYGEFRPSMAAVLKAMSRDQVDADWEGSFAGVIARSSLPDGSPIRADEVLHLP